MSDVGGLTARVLVDLSQGDSDRHAEVSVATRAVDMPFGGGFSCLRGLLASARCGLPGVRMRWGQRAGSATMPARSGLVASCPPYDDIPHVACWRGVATMRRPPCRASRAVRTNPAPIAAIRSRQYLRRPPFVCGALPFNGAAMAQISAPPRSIPCLLHQTVPRLNPPASVSPPRATLSLRFPARSRHPAASDACRPLSPRPPAREHRHRRRPFSAHPCRAR